MILVPRSIYRDPFRGGQHLLCMCECEDPHGNPLPSNTRANAAKIFSDPKVDGEVPWYGIEQEYALLDAKTNWPLGWPEQGFPGPQGPYYCAVGANKISGREICDAHFKACLYAGLQISGTNGEVMPSQWEYQIGPCEGISSGDQMWISRYLLERICEMADVVVTFDPKPIPGDWNGSGAHCNYSTASMRADGGLEVIKKAIGKLEAKHDEHIKAYGDARGSLGRTGRFHRRFSWGVADGASVRVGREVEREGKGYFEDGRPASNMDPCVVTSLIAKTTCSEGRAFLVCSSSSCSGAAGNDTRSSHRLPASWGGREYLRQVSRAPNVVHVSPRPPPAVAESQARAHPAHVRPPPPLFFFSSSSHHSLAPLEHLVGGQVQAGQPGVVREECPQHQGQHPGHHHAHRLDWVAREAKVQPDQGPRRRGEAAVPRPRVRRGEPRAQVERCNGAHKGAERKVNEQEGQEAHQIPLPDAVVHPRAVVVEPQHAPAAPSVHSSRASSTRTSDRFGPRRRPGWVGGGGGKPRVRSSVGVEGGKWDGGSDTETCRGVRHATPCQTPTRRRARG